MDPSKTNKLVEFHKSNPLLSKVIIGSTGILRKITGKESAAKKQSIANMKERATIDTMLGSNKVLNKASVSMLMNKLSSDKSSPDLRKKVIEKLKSDQKKLKEQSMSMSVLSPSRAMTMSPSAKSSASSRKSSVSAKSSASSKKSSASSKKSSASSKKSSASSKKSSASSKKSYEANEFLPVMRYKTSYI
jgi:hypothetical protein